MIAKLCGVAVDARVATRTRDPVALAEASRWIAANALAIRGVRVELDGAPPVRARFAVRCARGPTGHRQLGGFADLLAALAAVPALVDPAPLPVTWRLALRALGIPMLDAPGSAVSVPGASTLAASLGRDPVVANARWLEVIAMPAGVRVRVAEPRMLAA